MMLEFNVMEIKYNIFNNYLIFNYVQSQLTYESVCLFLVEW